MQVVEGDPAVEDMFNTSNSRLSASLLTSLEDLARFLGRCSWCKDVLKLARRRAWSDRCIAHTVRCWVRPL